MRVKYETRNSIFKNHKSYLDFQIVFLDKSNKERNLGNMETCINDRIYMLKHSKKYEKNIHLCQVK